MESTLHRQLKALYGGSDGAQEVHVRGYRIDAVARGRLIEVQQASLSAIRDKIVALLSTHRVTIVKPLPARTFIVRRETASGPVISSRFSPLRHSPLNIFEELVHFTKVFPHARLLLEVVMVDLEEDRIVRKRRRFNRPDYHVTDRRLREIVSVHRFRTARDLEKLLPESLTFPFDTAHLAREAKIPRWLAQKMAYCLRKVGVLDVVGKSGNAVLYDLRRRLRSAA